MLNKKEKAAEYSKKYNRNNKKSIRDTDKYCDYLERFIKEKENEC